MDLQFAGDGRSPAHQPVRRGAGVRMMIAGGRIGALGGGARPRWSISSGRFFLGSCGMAASEGCRRRDVVFMESLDSQEVKVMPACLAGPDRLRKLPRSGDGGARRRQVARRRPLRQAQYAVPDPNGRRARHQRGAGGRRQSRPPALQLAGHARQGAAFLIRPRRLGCARYAASRHGADPPRARQSSPQPPAAQRHRRRPKRSVGA